MKRIVWKKLKERVTKPDGNVKFKLRRGSIALFLYGTLNKIYTLNKYQTQFRRIRILGKSDRLFQLLDYMHLLPL